MNLQQMAAQARDHWKKTNPRVYKKMVKNGDLISESEAAAKLTMKEMEALMKIGMTEQETWQESQHLFIFKAAEAIDQAYQPE